MEHWEWTPPPGRWRAQLTNDAENETERRIMLHFHPGLDGSNIVADVRHATGLNAWKYRVCGCSRGAVRGQGRALWNWKATPRRWTWRFQKRRMHRKEARWTCKNGESWKGEEMRGPHCYPFLMFRRPPPIVETVKLLLSWPRLKKKLEEVETKERLKVETKVFGVDWRG